MTTTSRWGRTRSGGSPWPSAVAIGPAVTGLVAGLAAAMNSGERAWLLPLVLVCGTLPIGVFLGWVIVVDRTTLPGAVRRPEESVEGSWYDKAARDTFHDTIAVAGVVMIAVSVIPSLHDTPAGDVLPAFWLLAAADVKIRYEMAKRAG